MVPITDSQKELSVLECRELKWDHRVRKRNTCPCTRYIVWRTLGQEKQRYRGTWGLGTRHFSKDVAYPFMNKKPGDIPSCPVTTLVCGPLPTQALALQSTRTGNWNILCTPYYVQRRGNNQEVPCTRDPHLLHCMYWSIPLCTLQFPVDF